MKLIHQNFFIEENSFSNEPVVKDVEVVEKISKPLIPQELDIEQVEVKESSSDKEYIDEETDDNIEIECVVIEDYIEDKDKPLIREKLLKEINEKYGDKLTADEKANKIRNLIENNGVITKCVVSGKTKEEIENTIKDQIINDRDNFIDTLRKITNRVRMDKAIVHKNIIPDSINNFDNTIYGFSKSY